MMDSPEQLKILIKPEITPAQLREYAEASGDHNPIHLEPNFAKEAGFPSVIAHGMLSMAFMADCLQNHFAPQKYAVKRLQCRFRKVTFPGDVIRCGGEIKAKNPDGTLTLALWTQNQKGENTSEGSAIILTE